MISASALPRLAHCTASAALPHVGSAPSDEAARGTAAHEYLFALNSGVAREEALAAAPDEHRAYCASIALEPVPGAEAEAAVVYDVRTGAARRVVAKNRDYGVLGATEIPGTTDLYIPPADEQIATIADWKTTTAPYDAAKHIPQLELYALAFARAHGLSAIAVEVVEIDDAGQPHYALQRSYDWEDLAEIAVRVRATFDRVTAQHAAREQHERTHVAPWTPDVTEGEHCKYCPAWRYCPAKQSVLSAIGPTPEPTGDAYLRAQDAKKWAELGASVVKEAVAQHGPLPTSDGREVRLSRVGSLLVSPRRRDSA